MFRFFELELHGWDFWPSIRIPLDADVVILSGPNGSGKTTMLDAVRQILNAHSLSQNRRLAHYLRRPNQPALIRAVVSNKPNRQGRRPFETQRVFTDEATLACGLVPNGGSPEKRFAVLPGRPSCAQLQNFLLDGRDWLSPDLYRRVLDRAGVSRSLMHILALQQGRADELSRKSPKDLFRWVLEARGSQQVLERYNAARVQYQDSLREVERQQRQLLQHNVELNGLTRLVDRLDQYELLSGRLSKAEALTVGAALQARLTELRDIERKLPELRTRITSLTTTVDRLGRELEERRSETQACENNLASSDVLREESRAKRDLYHETKILSERQLAEVRRAAADLSQIAKEDLALLEGNIEYARQQHFRITQQIEDHRARLLVLVERISRLEKGIPVFPDAVQNTLNNLSLEGISCVLAATCIEVEELHWTQAVESALGPLRYALCLAPDHLDRALVIAQRHGFPGPLVTDTSTEPVANGPVRAVAGAPDWFADWIGDTHFKETDMGQKSSGRTLYINGFRRDSFGAWVSEVDRYVLGGNAIARQLEQARTDHNDTERSLAVIGLSHQKTGQEVADLAARIETQKRRIDLESVASGLPRVEEAFKQAHQAFNQADTEWKRADKSRDVAQEELDRTRERLKTTVDTLAERRKEFENTGATLASMESDLLPLQEQVVDIRSHLSPEIIESAEAGKLPSPELAQYDFETARTKRDRFRQEEPLPDPTIRDQHKLTLRNIQELEQHVKARQREADSARTELDECRGEYLQVIGSVLHDYRKRAGALADIAGAKLEVELPSLENTDRSIDDAGIVVRIGFDGKYPTEIGDTAHSGGQQVIAGLVLLMAMAETEGDSFFIVDEPFAHLSLDRIDEVGRFLRGCGSQFLITVPTTLDRGQLDPASLLVVLSKKDRKEEFAPRPIVARV
jgi:chromosome segregation ATPase